MSTFATPPSPAPKGPAQPAELVETAPAVPSFEDRLKAFWNDNRMALIALCAVVLLVITGKGLWQFYQAQREASIAGDYGKASSSDQLKAFVASHEGHILAGAANLRLADEAYEAGKFADAGTFYDKAVTALEAGPLASRARIGAAVSKIAGGDRAGGEAALKALSSDLAMPSAVRAEATYHLASLAAAANDAAALQTLVEQLNTIAPQSLWTQRGMMLRARQLTSTPPSATPGTSTPVPTPTVTFPSAGK